MWFKILKIIVFSSVASLCSVTQVFASTYYVSPSGNDTSTGNTQASPWKTIQKAASTAKAGDIVYVRSGTYREQVEFINHGTSASRITFSAFPNETPIIDGAGKTSISNDGLVQIDKNFITFSGFTIKNSPNMGIANRGSDNIISNNKILLSYDTAIWHRFGTNVVIRNNEVYNNVRMFTLSASESSIVCDGGASWWPATLNSQDSSGALWEGNYVHNNCGEGIVAHDGDRVIRNTFRDNWSVNMYIDNGSNILMDKNFVYDTNTDPIAWPGNGRNIPVGIAIADERTPCATSNNTISNNVFVNARFGVSFYPYVSCSGLIGTRITGNTFINSWEYGIRIQGSGALNSGSSITNNIFYSTRGKGLTIDNPKDTIVKNNLWYSPSGSSTGYFAWGGANLDLTGLNGRSASTTGNLWVDPQFSSSLPSDLSQLRPTHFSLKNTSPAAGLGAHPNPGQVVDIGASPSQSSTPTPPIAVAGDFDNDQHVTLLDYNLIASKFGNPYTLLDYNLIASNFGK